MEIIDAQISRPQLDRPWEHGADSERTLCVELAREAMDSVGVDAALIQGGAEFLEAAHSRYPERFRGAPLLRDKDVESADLESTVARLRSQPGMLAFRVIIRPWKTGELSTAFKAGAYNRLFGLAEQHAVPIFITASGYLGELHPIAEAYPKLTLIVDHCGLLQQPNALPEDLWRDVPQVIALARHPNLALKVSGVVTLSRAAYPHLDIWPPLGKILRAFGAERLMWGSDFTRLRFAPGTDRRGARKDWYGLYSDSVGAFRDTGELSSRDKQQFFGGTIRRLLRWG
jgi:L-fuconolactonase